MLQASQLSQLHEMKKTIANLLLKQSLQFWLVKLIITISICKHSANTEWVAS